VSTENVPPSLGSVSPDRPWWLGFAVIAVGAFWVYGASDLALGSTHAKVGPGAFVLMTGIGLMAFGVLLLVQIARGERFESQDAEDAASDQPTDWTAFATAIVGASIPLYTMERFGFVPTAMLMFALITRAFGSRRILLDLAIGGVLAGVAWYGFSKLGVDLGRAYAWPKLLNEFIPRFSLT
jgi:putative tricarboxylic transport membrane protein